MKFNSIKFKNILKDSKGNLFFSGANPGRDWIFLFLIFIIITIISVSISANVYFQMTSTPSTVDSFVPHKSKDISKEQELKILLDSYHQKDIKRLEILEGSSSVAIDPSQIR